MHFLYSSPIGPLTIVSDGQHITNIHLHAPEEPGHADFLILQVCHYLDDYFSGNAPAMPDIPLKPTGTVFQMDIWNRLQQIPYGHTVTYGQIANEYAADHGIKKMSAQAVGQAVGANPIPVLIPCHRVMGKGGKLTGFSGGLEIKTALLVIEAKNKVL